MKQSGFGRDGGSEALDDWTTVKAAESTPTAHYVQCVHYVMSSSLIRHDMNIECLNMNMFIMSNRVEYDLHSRSPTA